MELRDVALRVKTGGMTGLFGLFPSRLTSAFTPKVWLEAKCASPPAIPCSLLQRHQNPRPAQRTGLMSFRPLLGGLHHVRMSGFGTHPPAFKRRMQNP